MRLFKYVATPEAAIAVAGGSLKFTAVAELNDPMEVMPFFDEAEVSHSLQALRENGISAEQLRWLRCQQNLLSLLAPEMMAIRLPEEPATINALYRSALYDHLPILRQLLVTTIHTIRSKVGILSLSARADCVPMWAHYASGAAGFVVAIDDLDRFYTGDETGSLNAARPVAYSDRFVGMTFDPASQERLFFSKLDDWAYEREWRVVRALANCTAVSGPAGRLNLDRISPDHVRAVICGWNVTDECRERLRNALAETNPDALLIASRIVEGRIVRDPELPE